MTPLAGFSDRIFRERYAITPDETWEMACARVSRYIASAELNGKSRHTEDDFFRELTSNRFMPGGRIWYGCGRPKGQLLNCFVQGCDYMDSREGWGKVTSDSIIISGTGGGIGINFSPVRPRGSEIRGHSGRATGSVSLMEIINSAGEVIRAGGGRRTAIMMCLNHDHPDLMEFMDKKLDLGQLNNANVSVVFMNEPIEKFLAKVDRDEMHNLMWNGEVVRQVPARHIWNKILDNAVKCGEPGILNGWLWNEQNNIHYYQPLISTNPCGEIALEKYGCCDLGALVLPRFIVDGRLDRRQLARTISTGVRFLDNVLDVNNYPLAEIKENCEQVRRIGLGVMGLHDMLVLLGMKYTSSEAKDFVRSLFSFIRNKSYDASIDLSIEKGQFPALNRSKFIESGFCQKSLSEGRRERILMHGIRNCAVLTIAPTGTTSIVAGCTSGIEPMYTAAYRRRFRSGDDLQEEIVMHPMMDQLLQDDDDRVKLYESALNISPDDHIEMQAICQKYVDNAISKTINLPENYTSKDIDPILRRWISQLKGVTLYRSGSRGESPIEPLTVEQAMSLGCKGGSCDL